jgi:tetratricopeptide (TPR) repeat protein
MDAHSGPQTLSRYDVRAVPVTATSSEAIDRLEHALCGLLGHREDTGQRIERALASDPLLVPALCMQGFAYKCLARRDFEGEARARLHAARQALAARGGSDREHGLVHALERWCESDPLGATGALAQVLQAHPRDVLAFKMHHALNFILGRSTAMRAASEAALSTWNEGVPSYGYVLGCHAFALEETGALAEAESIGRRAVELEPLDAWGAHAVAHVFETQDRPEQGLRWMDHVEPALAGCNNFAGHLAWHRSLFLVQRGELEAALHLYDSRIAVYLGRDYRDVCNASSLLWRLEQEGLAVGDRWERLAELARARLGDHTLGFADTHYVLALAAAGDLAGAARFVASMRDQVRERDDFNARVSAEVAVPVSEGIVAFVERRSSDAARALLPVSRACLRLGGSNAQRDLVALLLLETALQGDQTQLARSLLAQRLAARPGNGWAKKRLERVNGNRQRAA